MQENGSTQKIAKISLLCGIGGLLEFYDFILYIIFSDQISKQFFEEVQSSFIRQLIVIGVFSVAYIVRPLGGVIVGWLGDTIGRKTSFAMTMLIMGSSVFLMGIMPTYTQIGVSASIIFVLLRIIQGFALGGELPSAIVFVFESLHHKKGVALGIMFGLVLSGFLLGNVMSLLLRNVFGDMAWRAAFISGATVGIIAYYIRSRLQETALFTALKEKEKFPPKVVITEYLINTLGATLCVVVVGFYGVILSLYLPKYLTMHQGYSQDSVNTVMILSSMFSVVVVFISSWLSDYVNYRRLYQLSSLAIVVTAYPIFLLIANKNFPDLATGVIAISTIAAVATGLFMRIVCEAFPTKIRLTGVAIAYNIAFAVVGGVAPLAAEIGIKLLGNVGGISIIAIICGLSGVLSIPILNKQYFLKD
jgi:MFS family permease